MRALRAEEYRGSSMMGRPLDNQRQNRMFERNRSFGAQNRVGRLVEAWAVNFNSMSDVLSFGMEAARAITEVPGQIVICTDYSHLQPLSFGVLRTFLDVLRRANPRLLRAALVVPPPGTELRQQVADLVRAAHHTERRLCEDAAEAKAWLCSVLNHEEQRRLEDFFLERKLLAPTDVSRVHQINRIAAAADAGPPSAPRRD